MTGAPTPRHTARYFSGNAESAPDGRLYASVYARNFPPVLTVLTPWMAGLRGTVLELGCGTGQHAASFALAFPNLAWFPSDPDPGHRASAQAWATELGAPARTPLAIDAAADWAGDPGVRRLGSLTAVLSMNVIHIAPWAVCAGILAGAAKTLAAGGLLIFYGPFREAGQETTPGNVEFDTGLRAENPEWGLREVGEIRRAAVGFDFAALIAMPANNRLLIFRKT